MMMMMMDDDDDDDDDDDNDDAKGDHLVVAVDVLLPQVSILLLQLFQLVSHPVLIRMTVIMIMVGIYWADIFINQSHIS